MICQEGHGLTHSEDRPLYLLPTLSFPLPLHALHILKRSAARQQLSKSVTLRFYLKRGLDYQCFQLFLLTQFSFFEQGVDEVADDFAKANLLDCIYSPLMPLIT